MITITEVKILLAGDHKPGERVKAYANVTIDNSFVVKELRILEGSHGLFVVMPSRKVTDHCPNCARKNHLLAGYCNYCGDELDLPPQVSGYVSSRELHMDIAHPINTLARTLITKAVLQAYWEELERVDFYDLYLPSLQQSGVQGGSQEVQGKFPDPSPSTYLVSGCCA